MRQATSRRRRYQRHGEHDRMLTEVEGLDESIELESVAYVLAVDDAYDGVF